MKTNTWIAAMTTVGLMTGLAWMSAHAAGPGNPNPGIVPPGAVYKGKTAGEWTIAWWDWVLGTEGRVQMFDDTGDDAYVNNNGADGVFFLAKTWSGESQVREIVIPSGTPLLIPVMGLLRAGLSPFEITEEFIEETNATIPDMYDLSITINGQPVACLEDGNLYYLNTTGAFQTFSTSSGLLDAYGYEISLLLTPLPPGEHVIEMKGKFGDVLESDVTYYITVEPGRRN